MINGQDCRRSGLLPGQRGGRCHRRPDRWQRLFESMSRPHPALDEIAWCCWRAAQPAGLRVGHSFQHPGSISPSACRAPQHLVEIVHRRSIRESPRTTGDTGALLRPATVLIAVLAGGVFCTSRRGVGPVEPGPSGQPTGRGGNCLESDEEDAAPPDPEVNLPRFGLLVRWRDGEIG